MEKKRFVIIERWFELTITGDLLFTSKLQASMAFGEFGKFKLMAFVGMYNNKKIIIKEIWFCIMIFIPFL